MTAGISFRSIWVVLPRNRASSDGEPLPSPGLELSSRGCIYLSGIREFEVIGARAAHSHARRCCMDTGPVTHSQPIISGVHLLVAAGQLKTPRCADFYTDARPAPSGAMT